VEPIRVHLLNDKSGALDIVRRCDLIPLVSDKLAPEDQKKDWNILGRMYQYVSTPLNTEELSIATSLPRRDVPGLRFVKTSVRFANNPARVDGDTICLGKVVDTGVVQNNEYRIDPNALVRHAIVAGSTGSGKSTTCKTIIREVLDRNIPVMIIEPAKDDYVRWAISWNKKIDADDTLSEEEKEKK
jgi:Cdc6-like AAA superfamily ATPase